MNEVFQQKCQLLTENRNVIRKVAVFEGDTMAIAAAYIFTEAGVLADADRLKECWAVLKQEKGIFSEFRGLTEMIIVSKMALSLDPAGYLSRLNTVFKKIRKGRIFSSSYMVLAAISIADRTTPAEEDAAISLTKEILDGLNEAHRFLTDEEDLPMAALMALSGKDKDQLLLEAEAAYQMFKPEFAFHKNAVQGLGLVIASLDGDLSLKCEKVCQIYDTLRARKIRYGKDYELAALGCLSATDTPTDQLVDEMIEASDYLKSKKGFGAWSIGKSERLMFAALLTAGAFGSEAVTRNAAAVSGAISTLIATQIALMILMLQTTTITAATSTTR